MTVAPDTRGRPAILRGRAAELRTVTTSVARRGLVVVASPPGMGLTCLLRTTVADLSARGHRVTHLVASALTAHVPLGTALCEPVDPSTRAYSRAEALQRLVRKWSRSGPGAEVTVVVVDDAQWLDRETAAVLVEITGRGAAGVLLGVSAEDETSGRVPELCKDRHVDRVRLGPLDVAATAALLTDALGGSVTPHAAEVLAAVSGGVPRLLHDLVGACRADGALQRDRFGVWHLVRTPTIASNGTARYARQVARASAPVRSAAASLVAAGAAVPLDIACDVLGHDVLAEAETAGLIRVEATDDGSMTVCGTPWAAVLGDDLGVLARRGFLGRLVDSHVAHGRTTGVDALQIVQWNREIGRPTRPALLQAAAEAATVDGRFGVALELARSAGADDDPAPDWALSTAAAASHWLGRTAEANDYYDRARHVASDPRQRAGIGIGQAATLFEGGHLAEARAALQDVTALLASTDPLCEVAATLRAGILLNEGQPGAALRAVEPVPPEPPAVVQACVTTALVELGRPVDALRVPVPPAGTCTVLPVADALSGSAVVRALGYTGEWDRAVELAERGHRDSVHDRPAGRAIWAGTRGDLEVQLGAPARGLPWLLQAVRLQRSHTIGLGPRTSAQYLASVALALVDAGRPRAARHALDEAELVDVGPRVPPVLLLARVRAADDHAQAAALASVYAERMLDTEQVLWQARALLEMALQGRAERAAELVDRVAPQVQGPVLTSWMDYVGVLARPRRHALAAFVPRFRRHGLVALAEDAAARAGRAPRPGSGDGEPLDELTRREREIVRAVACGGTSREIGERLRLSHRTVEAHLQRAYDRLGVHSRAELAALLDERGGPTG